MPRRQGIKLLALTSLLAAVASQSFAADDTITVGKNKEGFLEEHLWDPKFNQAADVTSEISGRAVAGGVTADDIKSARNQQEMLGKVSMASDVGAGAGVAAYAYQEFFLQHPDKNQPSPTAAKQAEKLAGLQKFAGYALVGTGAVDLASGAYGMTAINGKLNDIKNTSEEKNQGMDETAQAAIDANHDASMHSLYFGTGKAILGIAVLSQANQTEKLAKELASASPISASGTTTVSPAMTLDPASQMENPGLPYTSGVSNAPVIAEMTDTNTVASPTLSPSTNSAVGISSGPSASGGAISGASQAPPNPNDVAEDPFLRSMVAAQQGSGG